MAKRPSNAMVNDQVQAAGKQVLLFVYSLIKTGEVHELNNEAWIRPTEKIVDNLATLFQMERQALTFVVSEGIAQINSHALWLDTSTQEQANELEAFMARHECGGIMFKERPREEDVKNFFYVFARFRAPEGEENPMKAIQEELASKQIQHIVLAPRPLRLEGVGTGVRGVASYWYYSKCAAGMGEVLSKTPIEVKAARRVGQEIVDTLATEQDFLCALTLISRSEEPHRRAVDTAVLVGATARGLGLSAIKCADLTSTALLAKAGKAYQNPDPTEFSIGEAAGVLVARQLLEGSKFTGDLARRVSTAIEHSLGADGKGPPFLTGAPGLQLGSQLVALATDYLDRVRGLDGMPPSSPLQVALDLLQKPPAHVELPLVRAFVGSIGLLPVSTVVELQNGDLGVVCDVDHLRGRSVYRKSPPPVSAPRKIYVERMRDKEGKVVPERKSRIQLDTPGEGGDMWAATRTFKSEGLEDLITRAMIRRPATLIAQLGVK